ncbi:MAG: DNA starvation/stationary phase protection protein, partial [Alphaproteobacteria bacterium]|nr:DNA starvation/stationary phase protection protein [Alphaproteobacteria bacterium]
MTDPTPMHPIKITENAVTLALQDVLANTYGLYLATHNYHWNVEGEKFVPLHALFNSQYNELFIAIDEIAERIRTLGEYALPFEGENIINLLKTVSNPLNKETDANARANRMVHNLIALNDEVINSCQVAKEACQEVYDDESENVMIERITA